jgi:hypothetical protein
LLYGLLDVNFGFLRLLQSGMSALCVIACRPRTGK